MMLVHIGQGEVAERVHNAWLKTLEDGVHTYDIFEEGVSTEKVGTREFAEAVIARMGQLPERLNPVSYAGATDAGIQVKLKPAQPVKVETVGVGLFLHDDRDPNQLGEALKQYTAGQMHLSMITNRGVKVWPNGFAETFCTDHWRCRFKSENYQPSTYHDIIRLQQQLTEAGFRIVKTDVRSTASRFFRRGRGRSPVHRFQFTVGRPYFFPRKTKSRCTSSTGGSRRRKPSSF